MKKLSAMLLLAGVFLAGCGNASSTENSSVNSKQVQIVAVGSTALQPLVESAQEQFVAKNANLYYNELLEKRSILEICAERK